VEEGKGRSLQLVGKLNFVCVEEMEENAFPNFQIYYFLLGIACGVCAWNMSL
jgi:hypothetical protein